MKNVAGTLSLLRAEVVRTLTITLRYPTEAVSALVLSTLLFLGIFFGAKHIGVSGIGPDYSLDGMVVSYFAWLLLSSAVGQPSSDIEEEVTRGTILSLYTSVYGIGAVLLCRSIANIIITVIQSFMILLLIMLATNSHLDWTYSSALAMAVLFVSGLGLGFTLASLTMLLKRTQILFSPIYLLLLPATFLSVDRLSVTLKTLFYALPATPAAALLKKQLTGSPVDVSLIIFSLANAGAYAAMGALAMKLATRRTLKSGIAGHA